MVVDVTTRTPEQIYRLLTGILVPRPIAFVSSLSTAGVRNLAPFSFYTAVSANPPVICFCPLVRGKDGATKDTLRNISDTREFVVHAVSEDIARQMNDCSFDYPPDVDEFAVAGLTPVPSDLVSPPRVKEAPVAMECRLLQIVTVSPKPLGGSIIVGEVLRFHISDVLIRDWKIDPDVLKPIGRMSGPVYTRTTDRFSMERPGVPKDKP